MKTVFIYGLKDPNDNQIKYIGKANNPRKRYNRHVSDAILKKQGEKNKWIKTLKENNLNPILEIIEECDENIWQEREIYWISQFKNLFNIQPGGEYSPMFNKEIVKKMLETKRKNPIVPSKETKKKTSESLKKAYKEGRRTYTKPSDLSHINFSEKSKEMWKNRSVEEKLIISKKISKSNTKKVEQYCSDKKLIKTWASTKEIFDFYKLKRNTNISKASSQNTKWRGYYWKLVKNIKD